MTALITNTYTFYFTDKIQGTMQHCTKYLKQIKIVLKLDLKASFDRKMVRYIMER